jgi:hypothetical protein
LYFHSDDERKKGFLKLIENIRKWNATTMIISEDTTPEAGWEIPTSIYGIEKFTDGWIDLSYRYDEKKGERVRYLEVLKMKGVAHSMKPHQATISQKGFSLIQTLNTPAAKFQAARPPPQAPAPMPRFEADAPQPMRRIMQPPGPAADVPSIQRQAVKPPPQKQAAKALPPKPAAKKAAPQKGKDDRDVASAKMALAAKLAAAKSRIIKKSK